MKFREIFQGVWNLSQSRWAGIRIYTCIQHIGRCEQKSAHALLYSCRTGLSSARISTCQPPSGAR